MPRITAITAQKRNPQRANIYLDGEFAFGLQRIVAAWLQVGQEINAEKIAQLQAEDSRETAYQRALNYINYQPRTQAEIRRNLQEHQVSQENIENVIQRLSQAGLIDDARYAQAWVENRSEMRPRGRRLLAYEMHRRGIPQELVEQALETVDDEQLAYQAAQKQARKLRELEWKAFREKLYRFLASRGFGYEQASTAISRVWSETHTTDKTSDEGACQ
ncbi:MAG: RecX family transcriptional regulator [Anaerolineales bacterium]|nr:RecX family transcriptional regulator [Anaerolineales bacterium]